MYRCMCVRARLCACVGMDGWMNVYVLIYECVEIVYMCRKCAEYVLPPPNIKVVAQLI